MAGNLYRRGRTWWGRIQVGGREHRKSLRTASRQEALKRLDGWRREISHFAFHGENRHSWQEAVVKWAAEIAPGSVKPKTLQRYLVSLGQLDPYLKPLYLDEITNKTISGIVSGRKRAGATNATVRRDLTAASRVLAATVAWGWRDDNPARNWDRSIIRERRDPIRLPTPEEIEEAIVKVPAMMGRMMRLAMLTGMREDEIVTLEHNQVRAGVVDLTRTKTSRPRAVPLTPEAAGTIAGTPRHIKTRLVFWHDDGEPFRNFATNFGAQKRAHGIRFRFHDLRHFYAVWYLRAGNSIYDLQQNLGHTSIKTTEMYLDYLTADEQQTVKRVPAQMSAQV
ncbi:site-specific integrase [Ferrovibrio sp.]|uniref:tyrosine-type recombinase/integrase n=1 Tax=Ferrovibrio sp. TaxID=1917215 RepID=UPI00311F73C5